METTGDRFEKIGKEVGALVDTKQCAYGDSFGRSGEVMRILYPQGIAPAQMDDALAVVRVIDKLFRIATDKDALGESPWRDIAGYGLLGARLSADAEHQGAEEHDREKREEKCPGNAKYYKPAVGFNPWFFGKDPCRKEASDPAPGKPGDAVLGGVAMDPRTPGMVARNMMPTALKAAMMSMERSISTSCVVRCLRSCMGACRLTLLKNTFPQR